MLRKHIIKFLERILPTVNGTETCWNWTGSQWQGYGTLTIHNRRAKAHRVSYEIFKGDIPPKMGVLHRCDNPSCVNPNHLFVGTQKDNVKDMIEKCRQAPAPSLKGELHPISKLTTLEVQKIRDLRSNGLTFQELSKRYKISQTEAWRICKGLRWKEVPVA